MPPRSLRRADRNPKPGAAVAGGVRPRALRFGDLLRGAERNCFGSGADGSLTVSQDLALASTQDGDMVVRHYRNLSVNAGCTLSVANRCRGLLLYVDGDLTVNGCISMTARGCRANPLDASATADTPAPPSDGRGVPPAGLVIRRRKAGCLETHVAAGLLQGCGLAAVVAEARQGRVCGNGKTWVLPVAGGTGGPGSGGQTGGSRPLAPGGGGSGSSFYSGVPGRGGNATCFSGGVGSGGGGPAQAGNDCGGPGGDAASNGSTGACGGVGNPAGAPVHNGAAQNSGTGGLLLLIVRGNVLIAAGGSIVAHGVGGVGGGIPGGCSGGGNILLLRGGSYTNNGTVAANGGAGGDGSPWGVSVGCGGAGSVTIDSIDSL